MCEERSLVTRALVVAWSSRGTLLKADIAVKDCGLESEGCQPSQKASLLRACSLTVGVRVGKVQTPIQILSACNSIKPRILRNPKWPQVGIPQRMVAQPLNRTPGNRFLKPGQRQGRDRGPLYSKNRNESRHGCKSTQASLFKAKQ